MAKAYVLGKKPPRIDPRTLRLEKYLRPDRLGPYPAAIDWTKAVASWPMMKNDTIGDCTIAAAGHMEELWTTYAQPRPLIIPDDQIVAAYSAVSGYDPKTGANDNGAVELDVLNYWRSTGIGGRKITAYAAISNRRMDLIKQSVHLFGGVYIGVALPLTAQDQTNAGVWSVPSSGLSGDGAPGSWGGHAIPIVAYDPEYLTVVTWGQLVKMSTRFLYAYCDEIYAVLSPDWLRGGNAAPNGIDIASLLADLKAVTS